MINLHYKNRYDKYIRYVKSLDRNIIGYSEEHHIIPKCFGGTDTPSNLIKLTLREHHLAHWFLWKAYPDSLPLASAFLQMNNKNPKTDKAGFKPIPGKVYEALKTQVYDKLSKLMFDKVYVRDQDGNLIEMSKQEYAEQNELKFHTTGKVVVYDKETGAHKSIPTDEYHNNKDRYVPNVGSGGILPEKCHYSFLNIDENTIEKMPKSEARKRNHEAGYKKYKQIIKHKILAKDEDGNEVLVDLDAYKIGNYSHYSSNAVKVYDKELGRNLSIPREEYFKNPNRYLTSTKGKVLVKDNDGRSMLVSKEEFDTGKYSGHTSGLRTMYDTLTDRYVQLTEDEWRADKNRYAGPNKGKVNVINKKTGERMQIDKDVFDKQVYVSLGNTALLFRARNILTGKEKNVNIYEWDLVKDNYEIIDIDKFNKAMALKK